MTFDRSAVDDHLRARGIRTGWDVAVEIDGELYLAAAGPCCLAFIRVEATDDGYEVRTVEQLPPALIEACNDAGLNYEHEWHLRQWERATNGESGTTTETGTG